MAAAPQPASIADNPRHFPATRGRPSKAAQRLHELRGGLDVGPYISLDDAEPLILLPGQLPRRGRDEPHHRCRSLWSAILLSAAEALRHPNPKVRNEARHWLMHPDAAVLVNLRDCCDALGLDVRAVQRKVLPVRL